MPTYSINDPQPLLHIPQFSVPDQPAISFLIPTTPRKSKEAPRQYLRLFLCFILPNTLDYHQPNSNIVMNEGYHYC